jgi:hypothetical protein
MLDDNKLYNLCVFHSLFWHFFTFLFREKFTIWFMTCSENFFIRWRPWTHEKFSDRFRVVDGFYFSPGLIWIFHLSFLCFRCDVHVVKSYLHFSRTKKQMEVEMVSTETVTTSAMISVEQFSWHRVLDFNSFFYCDFNHSNTQVSLLSKACFHFIQLYIIYHPHKSSRKPWRIS